MNFLAKKIVAGRKPIVVMTFVVKSMKMILLIETIRLKEYTKM